MKNYLLEKWKAAVYHMMNERQTRLKIHFFLFAVLQTITSLYIGENIKIKPPFTVISL